MNVIEDKIGDRFHDLRNLPKEFLRPHRQSTAIINSTYMEDFYKLNPIGVEVSIPVDEEDFFSTVRKTRITEKYLFPDDDDPFVEYFRHFNRFVSNLGQLLYCVLQKKEGAIYKRYLKHRNQVIWGLCNKWGFGWIDEDKLLYGSDRSKKMGFQTKIDGINNDISFLTAMASLNKNIPYKDVLDSLCKKYKSVKEWREKLKINALDEKEVKKFLENYSELVLQQMEKDGIGNLKEEDLDQFDKWILGGFGQPKPHPFGKENDEINFFYNNSCFKEKDKIRIHWDKTVM